MYYVVAVANAMRCSFRRQRPSARPDRLTHRRKNPEKVPRAAHISSRISLAFGSVLRKAMSSENQPEAKRQRIEQQDDTTTKGDAMAEETSGGKMEAEATAEGE